MDASDERSPAPLVGYSATGAAPPSGVDPRREQGRAVAA